MIRVNGARYASLSGSGSTVFGIFDDEAVAKAAESDLSSKYRTIISHPTSISQ
jgi:4-diphosphocytidyl-2-C-methyl-D-erythritol kinase